MADRCEQHVFPVGESRCGNCGELSWLRTQIEAEKVGQGPCNHRWQPYADAERIWQACVLCGEERHVTTHASWTLRSIAYIFRNETDPAEAGPESSRSTDEPIE